MEAEISGETAAKLFLSGTVAFPSCFLLLQKFWQSSQYGNDIKKRKNLSDKDCADISVKVVSALQAIIASVCGYIVVRSECYNDVLSCTHPLVLLYAWFGAPYFLYDAFAMFYVSQIQDKHRASSKGSSRTRKGLANKLKLFCTFVSKSPIITFHHLVMAPIGFLIIIYFRGKRGDFFVAVMYLMEASTPFVSGRFILSKLKFKGTTLYAVNGALMLTTFPMFRIVTIFCTVGLYAIQQEIGYWEVFCQMHPMWLFVFVASIAPQIYWYALMCKGLIKIIMSKDNQNSPNPNTPSKNPSKANEAMVNK